MNRVMIATCGALSDKAKWPCCIATFHQHLISCYWICNDTSKPQGDLPLKYDNIRKRSPLLILKPCDAKFSCEKLLIKSRISRQMEGNLDTGLQIS